MSTRRLSEDNTREVSPAAGKVNRNWWRGRGRGRGRRGRRGRGRASQSVSRPAQDNETPTSDSETPMAARKSVERKLVTPDKSPVKQNDASPSKYRLV
ncbi:hypothetical protein RR48_00543 [Papilio machaon]|uniref:Uncharacterized protein n=1 Tax=Papilio machaon TaxID=76193 RepID=A0A0N0PFF7_PAPMA|nr:hypothetical protein RR48_00543 [Papilio machaon]